MIPDYYKLLGLERYDVFRMTDDDIFERLRETEDTQISQRITSRLDSKPEYTFYLTLATTIF